MQMGCIGFRYRKMSNAKIYSHFNVIGVLMLS